MIGEWSPLVTFALILVTILCLRWKRVRETDQVLPPGPKGWPIVGNLLSLATDPHGYFDRLHRKYGKIVFVRLPNMSLVVTNDPEVMKEFMIANDKAFMSRPPVIASRLLSLGGQDFALAQYGPHWKFMRRIAVQEVFLPKRLDACMADRSKEVDCLLQEIMSASKNGKPTHMRQVLGAYSLNILTRMLVGRQQFGLDEEETQVAKRSLLKTLHLAGETNIADYFPFLDRFDIQGLKKEITDALSTLIVILARDIENRRKALEANEPPTYIIDTLQTIPGVNGRSVSNDTIIVMILNLLAAGADTSSIVMEWTMLELILNPGFKQEAQAEIDRVVGKDRMVVETDLVKLTFLNACVRETLRFHPPTPFNLPRYSMEDTTISGYHIPKGTTLIPNVYGMGRSPDVWGESVLEYNPERWLTPEEMMIQNLRKGTGNKVRPDVQDMGARIIPFGIGRRSCPGYVVGTTMVTLGIARMLQCFHWHAVPAHTPDRGEAVGKGFTRPPLTPLQALAVPRLPLLLT